MKAVSGKTFRVHGAPPHGNLSATRQVCFRFSHMFSADDLYKDESAVNHNSKSYIKEEGGFYQ